MAIKCTVKMVLRVRGCLWKDSPGRAERPATTYDGLVSCWPERTKFATDEEEATSELLYGCREDCKCNLPVRPC